MHRLLFVCHGNICRSPMAEFVMKDIVAQHGATDRFVIESAATSGEEIGNPPHEGTVRVLAREGISCEGKFARRIREEDYEAFDYLIGMDEANVRNMKRFFRGDPEGKVGLLLEFAGKKRGIDDPWYTGCFDKTFADVSEGCAALWELLDA